MQQAEPGVAESVTLVVGGASTAVVVGGTISERGNLGAEDAFIG